jgi:hypothetical protein
MFCILIPVACLPIILVLMWGQRKVCTLSDCCVRACSRIARLASSGSLRRSTAAAKQRLTRTTHVPGWYARARISTGWTFSGCSSSRRRGRSC